MQCRSARSGLHQGFMKASACMCATKADPPWKVLRRSSVGNQEHPSHC